MFSAAVRGSHLYRRAWVPTESEKLKCAHDKNNPFDNFAIKTMNNSGQAVVHLPIVKGQKWRHNYYQQTIVDRH